MGGRTTLSIGIRYDLEVIPIDEDGQPAVSGGQQEAIRSIATTSRRGSASRTRSTSRARSVVRGGYGMFYNRTVLGAIDDTIEFGKFTSFGHRSISRTTTPIPARRRAGFPTDPFLVNGPFLNHAAAESAVSAGVPHPK